MSKREIVLDPKDEHVCKKPLTIWVGEDAKIKYRDIRDRYKRAPIVEDLTRLLEERIEEWHQKILDSENA